jgi:S1-C subfamily serine protease
MSEQLPKAMGIAGILVIDVTPVGPAEKAGLRATRRNDDGQIVLGDVIVAINDHKVRTLDDLYSALEDATIGDSVTVRVLRDGGVHNVQVTLGPDTRQ